ncbi:MAG: ZPR1 zinc finger domain-containing protein [Candidatus Heimdallarchaeota archaeon]|nr:ZPR1 zinc finger domain-containing protein [Candidatus Heimdallarchaeota archaeon]
MSTEDLGSEMEAKCPVCESENTKITQKILDFPHFPQMWFYNLMCSDCHFKYNDFINLAVNEPVRYGYLAENKDDYTSKIIRSSNGTIRFPSIGAILEPGPKADGFITNIEGMLRDFQGKAKFLLRDATTEEEVSRINNFIEMIEEHIKNNLPIEIIIEDPFGNSSIIPFDQSKLKKQQLSQAEAEKLKTGLMIFGGTDRTSE